MRTDLRLLFAGATLALAACLDPLDPRDVAVEQVIARVGQNQRSDTIQVRHTTRVIATAYAREGYDIGLTDFEFTSSDPDIATVDENGTVQGISEGTVTITASIPQGKSGSVEIRVVPSTIAYTFQVPATPGQLTFSTDYSRAYLLTDPDSLIVLDALGMFRLTSAALAHDAYGIAATATRVYITHPDVDSVTVVSKASNQIVGKIWVGAGPTGAIGNGNRAYIAARYDRKVVIVENNQPTLGIPVDGEPHELAISIDGTRLFASVQRTDGWHIVVMDPSFPDTLSSFPVSSRPTAIAANGDGSRVYVLLGSENRLAAFEEGAGSDYTADGSVTVGAGASGVSASPSTDKPYVVVSGEPATILDGPTLTVLEQVPSAGNGWVVVRPDGIFVFIASPAAGVVNVVEL